MQVLPRWRNVLILKNSFTLSPSASTSSTHLASFHSTPISFEKWKNKWNSDVRRDQQPSKTYIKYSTRQKRADTKKALNDLLFNSGSTTFPFQGDVPARKTNRTNNWDASEADHSDSSHKKARLKSSAFRSRKAHQKRMNRKHRRDRFEDFDEHPEKIFQAKFGSRCYSWSFNSWEEQSFQSSTSGFEWRENSNWTNSRSKGRNSSSGSESDDESTVVGSCSDRTVLGLPSGGPLKIEDVKNAFRLSALKWHPDKHQGSSQAMAEERFKLCVNAYNSLRNSLSSV